VNSSVRAGGRHRASRRPHEHAFGQRRVHVLGEIDPLAVAAEAADAAVLVVVALAGLGGDVAVALNDPRRATPPVGGTAYDAVAPSISTPSGLA